MGLRAKFALWKRVAYHLGADAFRSLLSGAPLDDAVADFLEAVVRDDTLKTAAVAALAARMDPEHVDRHIRLWLSMRGAALREAKDRREAEYGRRDEERKTAAAAAREERLRKEDELREARIRREQADAETAREVGRRIAARILRSQRRGPLPSAELRALGWSGTGRSAAGPLVAAA